MPGSSGSGRPSSRNPRSGRLYFPTTHSPRMVKPVGNRSTHSPHPTRSSKDAIAGPDDDDIPIKPVNVMRVLFLIILFFMGVALLISSHPLFKTARVLRLLGLLLIGIAIWGFYPSAGSRGKRAGNASVARLPMGSSIAERLLGPLSTDLKGRNSLILPVVGAVMVDVVFFYNWYLRGGISANTMGTFDYITITLGLTLVAYNFIPDQFSWSRDFFTFFIMVAFSILVLPRLILDLIWGTGEGSTYLTEILLVRPVSGLVEFLGIESTVSGDILTIAVPKEAGGTGQWSVGIGEACSGIYTATIFVSAYISFVLMEYRRLDRLVAFFLCLGILSAYLANILRITLIVWIAYSYDTYESLTGNINESHFWFAHTNLGWIIFILWIIPFWYLIFKYMLKEDGEPSPAG